MSNELLGKMNTARAKCKQWQAKITYCAQRALDEEEEESSAFKLSPLLQPLQEVSEKKTSSDTQESTKSRSAPLTSDIGKKWKVRPVFSRILWFH
jgi:hypothetical protein